MRTTESISISKSAIRNPSKMYALDSRTSKMVEVGVKKTPSFWIKYKSSTHIEEMRLTRKECG